MSSHPTILFVGESPPAGAPPDFRPFDCASGSRLAKVLGLVDRGSLLANVRFTNVFPAPTGVKGCPPWDAALAEARALSIAPRAGTIVCLGLGRVADAFWSTGTRCSWVRHAIDDVGPPPRRHVFDAIVVPHPSGQSQALNTDEQRAEVRRALLPDLCAATDTTLRPWHFRLDEPAILADLGLALCPLDPALGAAAAVICAEVWRALVAPASTDLSSYKMSLDVSLHLLGRWCRHGADEFVRQGCPIGVPTKSFAAEVRSRHKFAARTLPRPPSAEVRAAYARLVALGVAP